MAKFPTLSRASHPPRSGAWMMQIPVITTAHLPCAVYQKLAETMGNAHMATLFEGASDLLSLDDFEIDPKENPELFTVLEYMVEKGYSYLRFDRDGDEISDLPIYDWSPQAGEGPNPEAQPA